MINSIPHFCIRCGHECLPREGDFCSICEADIARIMHDQSLQVKQDDEPEWHTEGSDETADETVFISEWEPLPYCDDARFLKGEDYGW